MRKSALRKTGQHNSTSSVNSSAADLFRSGPYSDLPLFLFFFLRFHRNFPQFYLHHRRALMLYQEKNERKIETLGIRWFIRTMMQYWGYIYLYICFFFFKLRNYWTPKCHKQSRSFFFFFNCLGLICSFYQVRYFVDQQMCGSTHIWYICIYS